MAVPERETREKSAREFLCALFARRGDADCVSMYNVSDRFQICSRFNLPVNPFVFRPCLMRYPEGQGC